MRPVLELTERVGHPVTGMLMRLGEICHFLFSVLAMSAMCVRRPWLVVREVYFIGVLSLLIILVSGLFVGLVLGLQMYDTLERFGSGDGVGMVVALALVRELGPVLSALLFASRAGSAVTAEIGLMKSTEQLLALEMMAIQPLARIVAPRFWAGVVSLPLLNVSFCTMGIFGGYLIAVRLLGVDEGTFWSQMQNAVDFRLDIVNGVIKSLIFGMAISLIMVFEGFTTVPTAEGVSAATTRTVVVSALVVLALDFVLTAFMFRGF